MDTAHLEGLIGMLTVLGILVLLILPSIIGIAHDRRVDRQIRKAQQAHRRYFTTTATHHS
ncbi:hypothetical protein ABZ848_39135 [Streptomyces sp. NPDC047081]|uniref:hypothetical protein n=1 Tax=Streptomyces sp. NPDC047081 TaxID=3154706 RepID=UPI0033FC4ED5